MLPQSLVVEPPQDGVKKVWVTRKRMEGNALVVPRGAWESSIDSKSAHFIFGLWLVEYESMHMTGT